MTTRYVIAKRAGRHAIVRVLPSGEAAGYDPLADRENRQVHFRIYGDTPYATAIDRAVGDPLTRTYETMDDAVAAAADAGRECEIL
jgi:hypothetical protein